MSTKIVMISKWLLLLFCSRYPVVDLLYMLFFAVVDLLYRVNSQNDILVEIIGDEDCYIQI